MLSKVSAPVWKGSSKPLASGNKRRNTGSCFMVFTKRVAATYSASISPLRYASSCTLMAPNKRPRSGLSPNCTSFETSVAPRRVNRPRPLLPKAVVCTAMPRCSNSLSLASVTRLMLVFKPPHRPLSVVTSTTPTALTSRSIKYGWLYSGLACIKCAAISRTLWAYGRPARIRSCALRILDAATISMALVILRVFCTLLILVRISLIPGIALSCCNGLAGCGRGSSPPYRRAGMNPATTPDIALKSTVLLEILDGGGQFGFVVLGQFFGVFDALDQAGMLGLELILERFFEGQNLSHVHLVQVAIVDRVQRDGQFPHLQR